MAAVFEDLGGHQRPLCRCNRSDSVPEVQVVGEERHRAEHKRAVWLRCCSQPFPHLTPILGRQREPNGRVGELGLIHRRELVALTVPASEAVRTLEVLDAARQSAVRGEPVRLP